MTRRGPVDDRPTQRLLQLVRGWITAGGHHIRLSLLARFLEAEEQYQEQLEDARYANFLAYLSEEEVRCMPRLSQWFGFAKKLLPVALLLVPGGEALAPFLPTIIAAMTAAEADPGKTGAEKKAYVRAVTLTSLEAYNQIQAQHNRPTINPEVVDHALSLGIDAGVTTVNAFHTAVTPAAASTQGDGDHGDSDTERSGA